MRYCIHHCSGSGGMFLLTLFANFLNLKPKNQLDTAHGDYHNSGSGDWKNLNSKICCIGNYWEGYKNNDDVVLYYTHQHEYISRLKKLYPDNNLNDPMVYNKLHSQLNLDTINWHKTLDYNQVDYLVDFKTIFGLNNQSLEDIVSSITGMPVTGNIKKIIQEYQTVNNRLYF